MITQASRLNSQGCHLIELSHGGIKEIFTAAGGREGHPPVEMFERLASFLAKRPAAHVIRESVFGLVNSGPRNTLSGPRASAWPLSQAAHAGGRMSGVHLHSVEGAEIREINLDEKIAGAAWEDEHAEYCLLSNIQGADLSASREAQTRSMYERIEQALALSGMDFHNVIRTWLYLDNLLDWYGPFNKVRNDFFKERGVFNRLVPASTGVGGINAQKAAIFADAIAVRPKHPGVTIQAVTSPLQSSALDYGSSFSRAVEVETPDHRRLYVSGTASIDPDGNTVHLGDTAAQIDLSMRVVAAILESRGMSWADVNRAVVYIKDARDTPLYLKWCEEHQLPSMPQVLTEQDICRDDLLFEIEVDAAVLK